MFIVIDLNNGVAKSIPDLNEQQIQALTDCEDYLIIRIHTDPTEIHTIPKNIPVEIRAWTYDENTCEQQIMEGKIEQDGSIIQVR